MDVGYGGSGAWRLVLVIRFFPLFLPFISASQALSFPFFFGYPSPLLPSSFSVDYFPLPLSSLPLLLLVLTNAHKIIVPAFAPRETARKELNRLIRCSSRVLHLARKSKETLLMQYRVSTPRFRGRDFASWKSQVLSAARASSSLSHPLLLSLNPLRIVQESVYYTTTFCIDLSATAAPPPLLDYTKEAGWKGRRDEKMDGGVVGWRGGWWRAGRRCRGYKGYMRGGLCTMRVMIGGDGRCAAREGTRTRATELRAQEGGMLTLHPSLRLTSLQCLPSSPPPTPPSSSPTRESRSP